MTLVVVSVPWFADAEVWPFQLSAAAAAMSGALLQFGGASTVQLELAGDPSGVPAGSVARTLNSWSPSASPLYSAGEEQASQAELSSEHSNTDPATFDENSKLALELVVVASGCASIVVSGATTDGGSI